MGRYSIDVLYGHPEAHVGNTYALAHSHTGDFLFTGGEDGAIHMYEIVNDGYESKAWHVAVWVLLILWRKL